MSPTSSGYVESIIHTFTNFNDGSDPSAELTMDSTGALYGTTQGGGHAYGTAFKLTPKGAGFIVRQDVDGRGA